MYMKSIKIVANVKITSKRKNIIERKRGQEHIKTVTKGMKNVWKWNWVKKVDVISLAKAVMKT